MHFKEARADVSDSEAHSLRINDRVVKKCFSYRRCTDHPAGPLCSWVDPALPAAVQNIPHS